MREIRQLYENEISVASKLGDSLYSEDLWESELVFQNKYQLFPQGVFGCFVNNQMIGYIISHPWKSDSYVKLNETINEIPKDADCYYIHDCLVLESYRKAGIGQDLVQHAIFTGSCNNFDKFMLVSVNDSVGFWEKLGFKKNEDIVYAPNVPGYKMVWEI